MTLEESSVAYCMSRSLRTVGDLWLEWHRGINGGPAISALEELHGRKWRKSNGETQFYLRRKVIIDRVIGLMETEGVSEDEALQRVSREKANMSLDKFGKFLKRSRQ